MVAVHCRKRGDHYWPDPLTYMTPRVATHEYDPRIRTNGSIIGGQQIMLHQVSADILILHVDMKILDNK